MNGAGQGPWRVVLPVAQPWVVRASLGFALAGNGRCTPSAGCGMLPVGLGEWSADHVEEFNPINDPFTMVTGNWRTVNSMTVARSALGLAPGG